MSISKPVGFRGEICDTCLSCKIDPIFSFDRLESLVMTDHSCNSQDLSKIRNMADIANVRNRFHDDFIRSFARIISVCVGSEHMFLTAEVLAPPCSALNLQYNLSKILPSSKQRVLCKDAHVDLGRVSNNHWAHHAITGQDHKSILSKEELLDFLNITKSTFGAFQVELEDGLQHYLPLYINF